MTEMYYPKMQTLIDEATLREIRPEDIFKSPYDNYVDSGIFYNKITEGKTQEYKESPQARILMNQPGDKYYDILMAWLSDGEADEKDKLEPVEIRMSADGEDYRALDGRHRAMFCMLLGIEDLPFKWR